MPRFIFKPHKPTERDYAMLRVWNYLQTLLPQEKHEPWHGGALEAYWKPTQFDYLLDATARLAYGFNPWNPSGKEMDNPILNAWFSEWMGHTAP